MPLRRIAAVGIAVVAGSQLAASASGIAGGSRFAESTRGLTVKLGAAPLALALGGGSLWALAETGSNGAVVVCLDPRTGARRARFGVGPAGPDVGAITVADDRVWAVAGMTLLRLDPSHPKTAARVGLPGVATAVAVGPSGVWVTTVGQRDLLIRLNRRSLTVVARIVLPMGASSIGGPTPLALALGSVWVADGDTLLRIDPAHDRLSVLPPATARTTDLAFARRRLWALAGDSITLLDRRGRVTGRLELPFVAGSFAIGGARLWVIDDCGCPRGSLAEIDLETGRVVGTQMTGETPDAVVADRNAVWVANFGDGTLARYAVS